MTSEQRRQLEHDQATFEATFAQLCVTAGLSPLHREIVTAHYLDQLTPRQILSQLKLRRQGALIRSADGRRSASALSRVSEVQELLAVGSAKLAALPEYREAVQAFGRDLLLCVENKPHHDDREPGVRGVTPAGTSERFQGARLIDGCEVARTQDLREGVTLLVQRLRPSMFPTDASLSAAA